MANNLQKKTLNLRAGDWDFIESIARPNGLDVSTVIRRLVSEFVDKRRQQLPPSDTSNVEINL